jgi:hypothetical protein
LLHLKESALGQQNAIQTLIERATPAPDAPNFPFLTIGGKLREEIARALGGRSLRAEIAVTGDRPATYRLVFTPAGNVALVGADVPPHVRLHGLPAQLTRLVLGEIDTFTAVCDGLLTLNVPTEDLRMHYPRLREVMGRVLDKHLHKRGRRG